MLTTRCADRARAPPESSCRRWTRRCSEGARARAGGSMGDSGGVLARAGRRERACDAGLAPLPAARARGARTQPQDSRDRARAHPRVSSIGGGCCSRGARRRASRRRRCVRRHASRRAAVREYRRHERRILRRRRDGRRARQAHGPSRIEVIGSASSGQYRKTTKTPQQIGQELGVRYLLDRARAMGEGRRRREPRAGESGADRRGDGGRQVAAAVRCAAHRRLPGAGGHCGEGRASAAGGAHARGAADTRGAPYSRSRSRTTPTCAGRT